MRDALKSYLSMASGMTEVTRQRALAAAKALVSQGEATAEQVSSLAEDLVAQTRANREAVSALTKFEVDRALGRVGLASSDEVGDLAARLHALETELRGLRSALAERGGEAATSGGTDRPVQQPSAKTESTGTVPIGAPRAKRAAVKKTPATTEPSQAAAAPPAKRKAPARRAAATKATVQRKAPAKSGSTADSSPGEAPAKEKVAKQAAGKAAGTAAAAGKPDKARRAPAKQSATASDGPTGSSSDAAADPTAAAATGSFSHAAPDPAAAAGPVPATAVDTSDEAGGA